MAILVTGAFGCIGAWVVKRLLAAGERPVVYDLGDDPWRMRMIVGPDRMRRRGDGARRHRRREAALTRVVGEHGIEPHHPPRRVAGAACAGRIPPRGALVNVVGTANVFEAARPTATA